MGVLGGVFVLKSGLRILIQAPEVPFSVPPKTPQIGSFWLFLAIENPIKAEKSTHMGRKGRRAKTKTVLKPVNQKA